MKKINIIFWTTTALFGAFMMFSAVGNVLVDAASVEFVAGKLGYPQYIIPFLGVAKVLGVIALFIPGFPRLKEWAYAGLFFDLAGATYSVIAVEGLQPSMVVMILPFLLMGVSYLYHHKREALKSAGQFNLAQA